MCDYSAKHTKQRAAIRGEQLISRSISKHTRGFAGVADQATAVCLRPGTELSFDKVVQVDGTNILGLFSLGKRIPHKLARFCQVDKSKFYVHHDALEFPDGTIVKLNTLIAGQTATVLQLPPAPKTQAEADEQKRAAYV